MDTRPVPGMGDLVRAPMPHPHDPLTDHRNPLGELFHDAMWSWEKAAIRAQNLKRAKQAAAAMQGLTMEGVAFNNMLPPPTRGPLAGMTNTMLTSTPPPYRSVMIGGPLPPGMKFPMPKLPARG